MNSLAHHDDRPMAADETMNMAFRSPRWRLRFSVQDLGFDVRSGRGTLSDAEDMLDIAGQCGASTFLLCVPALLLDALLSRAPEAVTIESLSPEDGALLCEHVLSSALNAVEKSVGEAICFTSIDRRPLAPRLGEIPLQVDVQGRSFPVGLTVQSPDLRERLAQQIATLSQTGPSAVPGMAVAIGPVRLGRDDIDALVVGDQFLLDGATIERLQGGVLLDESLYWPIEIIDGGLQVTGTLTALDPPGASRYADISLFFYVGLTGEASAMKRGDRVPLQRVDEKRMFLKIGEEVIGRGSLVNLPEGIAVRVVEKGAS
jgi:hypothetical protein